MDKEAVNKVKEHYARASQAIDTEESRRRGPGFPLRAFHNRIKGDLIRRFCHGADKVLDLCCGRGGDIRKWMMANVKYVKGLDLSEDQIKEARSRFSEIKNRTDSVMEFDRTDILGKELYEDPRSPYDIVACFFALHYFMVSESAIENLLLNVASNLKIGGYFICTCPDGKRVMSTIDRSPDKATFNSRMLQLVRKWNGKAECFGSAYTFSIKNTVTEGEDEADGSFEYLVFTKPLVQIGAKYGLKIVTKYEDPSLDSLFDREDRESGFKHFHPRFPSADRSLEWASQLNMAFVFQKVKEPSLEAEFPWTREVEGLEVTLPPPVDISRQESQKRKANAGSERGSPPLSQGPKKSRFASSAGIERRLYGSAEEDLSLKDGRSHPLPVRPVSSRTYRQLFSRDESRLGNPGSDFGNELNSNEINYQNCIASSPTFAARRRSASFKSSCRIQIVAPKAVEDEAGSSAAQTEDKKLRLSKEGGNTESEDIVFLRPPVTEPERSPSLILPDEISRRGVEEFIKRPGGRDRHFRGFIIRDRKQSKFYPTYRLYAEENGTFLLSARKKKKSRNSNYIISLQEGELWKESVGSIRSNFIGTQFTIYGDAVGEGRASGVVSVGRTKREMGAVMYEPNILGTRGPRKMTALLPNTGSSGHDLIKRYLMRELKEKYFALSNKSPKWNEKLNAYCLNFGGRVTEASVKNFQLVAEDNPDHVILQFGKVGKDRFNVDFGWPVSGIQAFAICLTSFDSKLACE